MSQPVPLLILSDAVSAKSGLGRIAGDLALRIHENMSDVYRVGSYGYGGSGGRKFPFVQYTMEGMESWILPNLPEVWEDFAGEEKGKLLCIWDASRLSWLAQPNDFPELMSKFPGLQQWLKNRPFELIGYLPIDASGPNDRLTFPLMRTLLGFDRLLAYGSFGEGVIRRTIGDEESDKRHLAFLPHGIDVEVFYELPRKLCRKLFFQHTGALPLINIEVPPLTEDEVLIGCVCTNQPRKDFSLACETVSIISKTHKVRFWAHTDQLERAWSIPALLVDYEILDKTVVSLGYLPDTAMAEFYSSCDVTIGPGLGEGMGYPIFESLFCNTPCVHVNYGGAPEWMNNADLLVDPVAYRHEGIYGCKRPVLRAQDFADKIIALIGKRVNPPSRLDWNQLWPLWENWFREV